jgi:hypothetical protein
MGKKEIYVSVDIEADGPIPGAYSMLNFGAAAFDLGAADPLTPIATFETNVFPLKGAEVDPGTALWWQKQPEAWAYVNTNRRTADVAMPDFVKWSRDLPGSPVMVVYPSYDFMWLHWYIMRFGGEERSPYSFSTLDTKSLAMVAMGRHKGEGDIFKGTAKRSMSKDRPGWFEGQPKHDHTGLADAIGQGMLFVRIMQELRDGV